MISHIDLGNDAAERSKNLRALIHSSTIRWAGNRKLRIYGKLSCASGKRMKAANRVFFETEQEALDAGYRPCGHCLREKYKFTRRVAPDG